jgi:hypothetical protein
VILVLVVTVYFATLTEVVVAVALMVQLRESGTALMGLKLGVSLRRILLTLGPPETSSLEIETLEWYV